MKAVRQTIELEGHHQSAEVVFLRDPVTDQWHADVTLPDGSKWAFRQEDQGPFHACELHAERLYWVARDRVNSGKRA